MSHIKDPWFVTIESGFSLSLFYLKEKCGSVKIQRRICRPLDKGYKTCEYYICYYLFTSQRCNQGIHYLPWNFQHAYI